MKVDPYQFQIRTQMMMVVEKEGTDEESERLEDKKSNLHKLQNLFLLITV